MPATHVPCGDPSLGFDSQGRLFWSYLGCIGNGIDIFIAGVNPSSGAILAGYPINVTASAGVNLPGSAGNSHDKQWIAIDQDPGSTFANRMYMVWTDFTGGTSLRTTFSTDQGLTWAPSTVRSLPAEGFPWPSHNAVASNGDVYVAYHAQPGFAGGAPDGGSGMIVVLRSTDGGVSYPQRSLAFGAGNADITFNVQTASRKLGGSVSWTQGSGQPWILPDPSNPSRVYVVANDDPTNGAQGGGGDDMDVFIARSTNFGVSWGAPTRVNSDGGSAIQFFPTAAIDAGSGCVAVQWWIRALARPTATATSCSTPTSPSARTAG